MSYFIRKASGAKEPFNEHKLRRSLRRSGTSSALIEEIVTQVKKIQPSTTQKLHNFVIDQLALLIPPVAARYNLKRALMELGPAGYPFERFVARIFDHWGYTTKIDQFIAGACVEHEVDVLAQKKNHVLIVECKFHNKQGLKSDVKVPLYIQARFEDIHDAWKRNPTHLVEIHEVWIVTNTSFTTQAIAYANCKNIKLLGWTHPTRNSLAHIIDSSGLHPITALPFLSRAQKRILIDHGLVLCRDASKHPDAFQKAGLPKEMIAQFIKQAQDVCTLTVKHDD